MVKDFRLTPMFTRGSTKSVLVAGFVGVALGTNYALIGIPNVKLMDALVFVAAFLFGLEVGVGVAVFTWAVYGVMNPWGQAGFPLLGFLMAGECFYAIAAVILRRTTVTRELFREGPAYGRFSVIFGVTGLLATFSYDVLTNFASWMFLAKSFYYALLIGMVTGAPFALVHEASNFVLFATAAPAAIVSARRLGLLA